jgi:hypothetical protein
MYREVSALELKQNYVVRWECNNWYIREDQLVQICTQDGGRVILNSKLTKFCINVEYEKTVKELWDCIKDNISWNEMEQMAEQFVRHELIRVIDEDEQFDAIFG